MIRRVALSGFFLALFSPPPEMPESENPVQLVPVSQRHNDHADSDAHQDKQTEILVMPEIASAQREQDRPEKPSCASNDKKFRSGKVP